MNVSSSTQTALNALTSSTDNTAAMQAGIAGLSMAMKQSTLALQLVEAGTAPVNNSASSTGRVDVAA